MANFIQKSIVACIAVATVSSTALINKAHALGPLISYDATTQASGTDFLGAFYAGSSPGGYGNPGPYGVANNTADSGWIWNAGGGVTIDLLAPRQITSFRTYSTYNGGSRGTDILVEHSDDGTMFSNGDGGIFPLVTLAGAGVNDAGDPELAGAGFAGWYEISFNAEQNPHQHWRLTHNGTGAVAHAPRLAEIEFRGVPGPSTSGPCLFGGDTSCDTADLNALYAVLGTDVPPTDAQFDMNLDNVVDVADLELWLIQAATENGYDSPYLRGDTGLDRDLDLSDYNTLTANFDPSGTYGPYLWEQGNFDGDGDVDLSDYNSLASNFNPLGYGTAAVPEPAAALLALLALLLASARGRLSNSR